MCHECHSDIKPNETVADMGCQQNKEGEIFAQIMFDLKNSQDPLLLAVFFAKAQRTCGA